MPVTDRVTTSTKEYWNKRFQEGGRIWGDAPSRTAEHALDLFGRHNVRTLLIPGSGYGRNARFFSSAGLVVAGIEISETACEMACEHDPLTVFFEASALDMSFLVGHFDAVYCFNTLHLFPEEERGLLIQECAAKLRDGGLLFFTVFSEEEPSFGKGPEVEPNTFESKAGRPVHYFTEYDLVSHFSEFDVIETGLVEDPEDHGEGPHTHRLRYIVTRR